MSTNESAWAFQDVSTAQFHALGFSGRVDLRQPHVGLLATAVDAYALAGDLLTICRGTTDEENSRRPASRDTWPLPVADAYARGDDLIATYSAIDDWPYAPQIYWRAGTDAPAGSPHGSVSLLISVQTDLLDTFPQIHVSSALMADEFLQISLEGGAADGGEICMNAVARAGAPSNQSLAIEPAGEASCLLWRLADMPISYVEIMPTSDFHALRVCRTAEGAWRSEWRLFAEFLEKGVIRRARIEGAFLPRENDLELAVECSRAFAAKPLPLTV